jgi:hypothetical protein
MSGKNVRIDGLSLLYRYYVLALSAIILTIAFSLAWNVYNEKKQTRSLVLNVARSYFFKDQAFRFWASSHGGVYVTVTEQSPPNPYLSHIPERDITTPSGKKLTLVNPAYMLRQVMHEFSNLYGVVGQITSLKPLNPINTPDAWQRDALHQLDKGVTEVSEFTDIGGKPYLRLLRPLITEASCLKCHVQQGYKVGDIRGGVSISMPMASYLDIETIAVRHMVLSHLVFLFIGAGALSFILVREKNNIMERSGFLIQQSKLGMLGDMISSITHQWKQPLNNISILVQDIRDAYKYGELTEPYVDETVKNAMKHINFMSRTIDDFRDFMKPSRDKAVFNIMICLDEILFMFEDVFKKDDIAVSIQAAGPDSPCIAMGYPNEFKQVILILLGNSKDAILARRKKTASNKYEPGKIVIALAADKGKSIITVVDNGGGIPEDILGKVFDPYFTTKSRDTGTGIGLYMAKNIIEGSMGGTINAGNTDGGAEFRIELF